MQQREREKKIRLVNKVIFKEKFKYLDTHAF